MNIIELELHTEKKMYQKHATQLPQTKRNKNKFEGNCWASKAREQNYYKEIRNHQNW